MRNIVILLMGLLGLSSCVTNNMEENYKMDFRIEGVQTGMAYLRGDYPFSDELMDSAKIENGKCQFKGKVSSPLSVMLVVKSKDAGLTGRNTKYYVLILENKSMELVADASKEENVSVEGSPLNDELKALQDGWKNRDKQRELWTKIQQSYKNGEMKKVEELQKEADRLRKEYEDYLVKKIPANSKSFALSYLISQNLRNYPYLELEKILIEFDASMANTRYIKDLMDRIDRFKKIEIGQVAPDFTLNDTLGNPVSLSSLRGKYVMVDFWASWCRPCCEELPGVVELYGQYREKGFEILGVSFDRDENKWKKAIRRYNMTWSNVSDLKFWDCEAGRMYNIGSIPNNIILDPKGKIIAKNLHGEELKSKLKELFGI